MNPEKRSAHIFAYFLSRFDKQALKSFDFKTDRQAFLDGAAILGVLPNYIKFRRDEFDVEHPHRKGWHKRKMSPSITSVINTFRHVDFVAMESIVRDILFPDINRGSTGDLGLIFQSVDDNADEIIKADYVPRTITGKKAEEAFFAWFLRNPDYFGSNAEIEDRRDHGCGYDFRLTMEKGVEFAVEVKGLSKENSGILFTSKEWDTARAMGENYCLALLSVLDGDPVVQIFRNPYSLLSPKRYVQKVVQINWTISAKILRKHRESL